MDILIPFHRLDYAFCKKKPGPKDHNVPARFSNRTGHWVVVCSSMRDDRHLTCSFWGGGGGPNLIDGWNNKEMTNRKIRSNPSQIANEALHSSTCKECSFVLQYNFFIRGVAQA